MLHLKQQISHFAASFAHIVCETCPLEFASRATKCKGCRYGCREGYPDLVERCSADRLTEFLGAMQRLQVIRSFVELNGGEKPDLLVFASNFWDIATYTTKNASKLEPEDLEDYVLEDFQDNLSAVLSTIEVCSALHSCGLLLHAACSSRMCTDTSGLCRDECCTTSSCRCQKTLLPTQALPCVRYWL